MLSKNLAKPERRHSERSEESLILTPFNVAMPTSYKSSPQTYKSSPQKSQKMNEKAILKPIKPKINMPKANLKPISERK